MLALQSTEPVLDVKFAHNNAAVGGLQVEEVDALTDPCPLPSTLKKRGLNERERVLYAPMADVGGLLYDKDAVYIDIPDWKVPTHSLTH